MQGTFEPLSEHHQHIVDLRTYERRSTYRSLDRLRTRAGALAATRSYTLGALGLIPGVALYCVAREYTQEGTRVRVAESLNKRTIIAVQTGFSEEIQGGE